MLAESNGIELSKKDEESAIIPVIRNLPPRPDVSEGLRSLKAHGFLPVSLTNSSNAGVKEQFKNAGLLEIVHRHLTVEGTHKFNPDLGVYRWALQQDSMMPSFESSRPYPEFLMPPKGSSACEFVGWLTNIMPVSTDSATARARFGSLVKTEHPSP